MKNCALELSPPTSWIMWRLQMHPIYRPMRAGRGKTSRIHGGHFPHQHRQSALREFYRKLGRKIYRQNRNARPWFYRTSCATKKMHAFCRECPRFGKSGAGRKGGRNYKGDSLRIWGHIRTYNAMCWPRRQKRRQNPLTSTRLFSTIAKPSWLQRSAAVFARRPVFKEFFIEASKVKPNWIFRDNFSFIRHFITAKPLFYLCIKKTLIDSVGFAPFNAKK